MGIKGYYKAVETSLIEKAIRWIARGELTETVNEFIALVERSDLSGKEKFNKVVDDTLDALGDVSKFILMALIEILVKDMNERAEEHLNGN